MDTTRIRELLDQRDKIDAEIVAVITGSAKRAIKCSLCQQEGHTARSCPTKSP